MEGIPVEPLAVFMLFLITMIIFIKKWMYSEPKVKQTRYQQEEVQDVVIDIGEITFQEIPDEFRQGGRRWRK